MIESEFGRSWLSCDFCKNYERRILPGSFVENELFICDTCQDKVEYLMDNFGRLEKLLDGE